MYAAMHVQCTVVGFIFDHCVSVISQTVTYKVLQNQSNRSMGELHVRRVFVYCKILIILIAAKLLT
jgi:hypothetical protein